ncbi:hypothetical protein pb186bvf_018230 [Paramecium bursaria]
MNQKLQGECNHRDSIPTNICLYLKCNNSSRLICQQCFNNKIHQHQKDEFDYVIRIQDLKLCLYKQQCQLRHSQEKQLYLIQSTIIGLNKISSLCNNQIQNITFPYKLINIKKIYFLRIIKTLREVIQKSLDFICELGQIYNGILYHQYIQDYNKLISDTESNGIKQIETSINTLYMRHSTIQQMNHFKQKLISFYQQIEVISQDFKQICNNQLFLINGYQVNINYKIDYQQYFKYEIKFQEEQLQLLYQSIQVISPDEQYFVFGDINKKQIAGDQSMLIIINLQNKKQMKELIIPNHLECCKFSNDSKFIYAGDCKGNLQTFQVNKNFQMISQIFAHQNKIMDLAVIKNNIVISCSDCDIKVFCTLNLKHILIIHNAHIQKITKVEYHSSHKLIISCSYDKSIKIHQMNGLLMINKQGAHNFSIKQIQLINSGNNLLSRSDNIKLWYINFEKGILVLIKDFELQISSISSVNNDKNIVICTNSTMQILDYGFNIISQEQLVDSQQIFKIFKSFNYSNSENFITFFMMQSETYDMAFIVYKRIS